MEHLNSIGQTRSLLERSLLYGVFYRRFFLRYLRLWRRYKNLNTKLDILSARYDQRFAQFQEDHDDETERLEKLLESERHRNRIISDEWRDRFLEASRSYGMRHSTLEADDKIKELRFQPFEPPKKKIDPALKTLAVDERAVYGDRKEHHFTAGREEGYTEAELSAAWKTNHDRVIEDIRREFGSYDNQ